MKLDEKYLDLKVCKVMNENDTDLIDYKDVYSWDQNKLCITTKAMADKT